ncbi:hypothetical protein EDI_201700 [Entamoeba dispar SAW760]|uniref:Uncharacterized protein n=1 Tax=Entamoeba dispar (strain ATCC PRA-260 / SAW760) TaxID=370354 RepID=B0ETW6_ENTDS|nr:uncharacterized protein EDI_201700 [Entamoeba dispar SAW760]EDR22054.1 hypothetical protein EDI_201700 [Entamoeba dispar SAW760]|eukprot:EDR22054.1 hypothetical protein EDI_201700 [Entamoeba dispar SAW760]
MTNRSVYSVTKTENTFGATRVDEEDAFDAFDDFDNIQEEEVKEEVVEQPKEVKEEEVKKEESINEIEEKVKEEESPKVEEKVTNKAGWCFEDFEGSGSIKPKIYASATGGSNVSVKKQPKKVQNSYTSTSSNVDWNKYKNAKSISSDQLFENDEPTAYEKQKLSQYSNASAIGSEEFFGKEEKKSYSKIDTDDEWGNDELSRMADSIANGAVKLATKAKSLFDDF